MMYINATKMKFFLGFFGMVLTVFAQEPDALFEKGNSQYAQGNYQEAVTAYEQVVNLDYESAALYFNLANSYYKLNRVAPSVYYYEKALQLKPNDAAIKNNLSFAQNMTIDAITPLPQNTFKKWNNTLLSLFSIDNWAILTVVLILLATLSFIIYYFSVATGRKRVFFTITFVAFFLGLVSLFMAFQAQSNAKNMQYAIIFSAEVGVHAAPNLSSDEVFMLHEGTKTRVTEENGEWLRIVLADGKEGWIPRSDLRIL